MAIDLNLAFILVFIRVGCLMMVAPVLGYRSVPLKFRLGLAVFVAVAVFPLVSENYLDPKVSTTQFTTKFASSLESQSPAEAIRSVIQQLSPFVLSEVTIGLALGLGVSFLVLAARTVGGMISQMAGQQWPSQTDASFAVAGEGVSTVSHLFGWIAMAAFVMINGPEMMIGAIIESYFYLPLGIQLESRQVVELTAELLQQSLMLTLRGVGPAVAAMIISTLSIGFISRAFPQMNILSLSISLNQIVMLVVILLTVGGSTWLAIGDLPGFLEFIASKLGGVT